MPLRMENRHQLNLKGDSMANQTENRELTMINKVLKATGEARVNTVDASPAAQSIRESLRSLKETLLTNEKIGWSWNVINIPLNLDANGELRLGEEILALITDKPNIMIRDNLLYDIDTDSTKNVNVSGRLKAIVDLDYNSIPVAARDLLVQQAILEEQIEQEMSQTAINLTLSRIEQFYDVLGATAIRTMLRDPSYGPFGNKSVYGVNTYNLNNTLM